MKSVELYHDFIDRIDSYEKRLLENLGNDIACSDGCSECCLLESVFPVEAYNILTSAGTAPGAEKIKERDGVCVDGRCVFLYKDSCMIYPYRPVICRTHGYPIFEDGSVDFCPKNFTGIQSMDSGMIIDLDALNRGLVAINALFLKENRDLFFNRERIPLPEIMKKLTGEK